MRVLGAHVPVSAWTFAVLVVGGLISVLAAGPLARRRGWRHGPTLVTLLLLTAALSVTATPGEESHANGLLPCLSDDLSDLARDILHSGGGVAADLLNVLLLLPLAGAIVVATRRMLPGVAVAVLLPVLIESAQTVIPGRHCSLSDVVSNVAGALAGVTLGRLALRFGRQRSALVNGREDPESGGRHNEPDQHVQR